MKFSFYAFLKYFYEMLNWIFCFPFFFPSFCSVTDCCLLLERGRMFLMLSLLFSRNTDSADVKASLSWNSYCSSSFHCGKNFLITDIDTALIQQNQREKSRISTCFHIVTTCFILSSICITFEISSVPGAYFCGYTK